VLNAGSIIGRVLPAALSDAFGRFNLIVPCLFLTGLSTLVLWSFANTLGLIMFYAIVYGFFSGAFNALIVPCIAQISDIREIGMRIGILYSILSFP
jgi:MFS family permease